MVRINDKQALFSELIEYTPRQRLKNKIKKELDCDLTDFQQLTNVNFLHIDGAKYSECTDKVFF